MTTATTRERLGVLLVGDRPDALGLVHRHQQADVLGWASPAVLGALLPAVVEAVDHGSRSAARGDRAAMLAAAVAAALATVVPWRAGRPARARLRHA